MGSDIPAYIAERIRRQLPPDASIVPGSTPVIAFGDVRSAAVATLGLNPSRLEFQDKQGQELTGVDRRLETLASLGVNDLSTESDAVISKVFEGCNQYFQRNPYRFWFDHLEQILQAMGASYYDGSACHLDLVQWATDPVWGKLPSHSFRQRLIEADAPFLLQQLQQEGIQRLLLNGRSVIEQFMAISGTNLTEVAQIPGGHTTTRLLKGRMQSGLMVIGWSTNLQSSFGVSHAQRRCLAEQVGQIV